MYNKAIKEAEKKMEKGLVFYKESLALIRAGRANPQVLDKVTFSYYGVDTPIKNAATISVPEARLLVIQPWDQSTLKEIEKAILSSDLGITPSNDGKVIRLPFPELTEDRRKELAKQVKASGEEAKITIRNARRDAMDQVKKMEKNSEISEDDLKVAEEDIQEVTDKYTKKIDEATKLKEKELMEI